MAVSFARAIAPLLLVVGCSSATNEAPSPAPGADAGDGGALVDAIAPADAGREDSGTPAPTIEKGAVCINGPSYYGGAIDERAVQEVLSLAPACVRVNFRMDDAPDLATAMARFDVLVDRWLKAKILPYMLVGHEAVNQAVDAARTQAGLDEYAAAFASIVGHFKDRVRFYEAFNEPNNWIAPNKPALDEASFARLLARVYRDVRVAHWNDPAWDVRIVSGALFSFAQNGGAETTAADYLDGTFQAGIDSGEWLAIRSKVGRYPLDHVGYHVYFDYESDAATKKRMRAWIDAIWAVLQSHEGKAPSESIFVSEIGWPANGGKEQDQARELEAAYAALRADDRVAMAMWFTYQDFDAILWGLSDASWKPRPARASFAKLAAAK